MNFTFSFNEKNKLVCTPSDLERPYCLIVFGTSMDRYTEGMTPEQIADTYQSQPAYCQYFTGVGTSIVYMSSYDSPYTAYAFGYDQALGEKDFIHHGLRVRLPARRDRGFIRNIEQKPITSRLEASR